MKSVLISIRPKWCELIASGKKTIEVRKTRPKIEAPFKVYIYCTHARNPIRDSGRILMYEDDLALTNRWGQGKLVENPCGTMMEGEFFLNGKVIGEFVCDRIDIIDVIDDGTMTYIRVNQKADMFIRQKTCLGINGLQHYLDDRSGYGWHISDLKIYDVPKELGDFWKADKCPYATENDCTYKYHCFRAGQTQRCGEELTRPPQSWCYVEELQ